MEDRLKKATQRIRELEEQIEVAAEQERLLRQRLQDVRMYLLAEADKHTPRDPILGEAYQMTQRHLGWRPNNGEQT